MSAQEKQALNQARQLAQVRECDGSGDLTCSKDGSGMGPEARLQLWAGLSRGRREAGVFGGSRGQNWGSRGEKGREVDLRNESMFLELSRDRTSGLRSSSHWWSPTETSTSGLPQRG